MRTGCGEICSIHGSKAGIFSSIKELKPGQEIVFGEPEEEAEQFMREMQKLNQIAQTLKDRLMEMEDVIKLNPEELENLKATKAGFEEFDRKKVCFVERNYLKGGTEDGSG